MTDMTPDELRVMGKAVLGWRLVRLRRENLDQHGKKLLAAADAWEADKGSWLQARDRLGELLDETASLRKRLEEAEKASDEYARLWHRDAAAIQNLRVQLEAADRWKRAAIAVMDAEGIYTEECIEATAVMLDDAALAGEE